MSTLTNISKHGLKCFNSFKISTIKLLFKSLSFPSHTCISSESLKPDNALDCGTNVFYSISGH